MTNDLTQHGTGNIGVQSVTNSNVNITQILANSYDYKNLTNQLETHQKLFARTPEDETQERLKISQNIAQLEAQITQFKQDVLRLAEEFNRIEINTDRLRRAKEHFEKGEIAAARAVFDSEREQMADENDRLVKEKERYEKDVQPKLQHSSDEYYLWAFLERTAYDNPNWLNDTCGYFECSINALATEDNVFEYALFLQNHNRFDQAELWYKKYLTDFAQADESKRATTLNNLAALHQAKNEFAQAEAEYLEALEIDRQLAAVNPAAYLHDVATTLNNLANLHQAKNELVQAEAEYLKALAINRQLATVNPATYLPDVAMTLNNLAVLHQAKNELAMAEALEIYRQLAAVNPAAYLPYVATMLNNLANLHQAKNELVQAEAEYLKALEIYRKLAAVNPAAYLPDVAMTLINIAIYHLEPIPNRERSINYSLEAVMILLPIVEAVPFTQNYLQTALQMLQQGWGLSEEEIQQMLTEK
jgi:tetratricopeptide (TPR) repeat protein